MNKRALSCGRPEQDSSGFVAQLCVYLIAEALQTPASPLRSWRLSNLTRTRFYQFLQYLWAEARFSLHIRRRHENYSSSRTYINRAYITNLIFTRNSRNCKRKSSNMVKCLILPQILSGASNSRSIGCERKISLDLRHRPRISFSVSCTFLPGRDPRTRNVQD